MDKRYATAIALIDKRDIPGARRKILDLITHFKGKGDLPAEIYGKILLTRTFLDQNELDESGNLITEINRLIETLKFDDDYNFLLAHSCEIQAHYQNYVKNYSKTIKLWFQLLELTPGLENGESFTLTAFMGIGEVYQISGMFDDARKCFDYAYQYARYNGVVKMIVVSGLYLMSYYIQADDYGKLNILIDELAPYFENEAVNHAWRIDYQNYRGWGVLAGGRKDEALEIAEKQSKKSLQYDYLWGLTKSMELMLKIFVEQDELDKAVECISGIFLHLLRDLSIVPSKVYLSASQLYERTGDFKKALEYMKEYRKRKLQELTELQKNRVLKQGVKTRYYALLLENYFLRWQLQVGERNDCIG